MILDSDADLEMAASIVYNAKTSRPSVCNAIETILVHEAVAKEFLPLVKRRLDENRWSFTEMRNPGDPGRLCDSRRRGGLGAGISGL